MINLGLSVGPYERACSCIDCNVNAFVVINSFHKMISGAYHGRKYMFSASTLFCYEHAILFLTDALEYNNTVTTNDGVRIKEVYTLYALAYKDGKAGDFDLQDLKRKINSVKTSI